ncbi:MAG: hypothetical protein IK990_07795 [Ruminiclostridium sp.]|nr:hypothetical protein [Ruminiclostridium sp.]
MPREHIAELIKADDWLPGIREYHFTLEDIDSEDSKRSEAGYMQRKILRPNVYHASVTHMCTEDEMSAVCSAVKAGETVDLNVLCPPLGNPHADITAYVSKLDCQLVLHKDQNGDEQSWWQINYTLVEV